MKVIPAHSFITSPWKNGGGVTHEIAKYVSGDRFDWRLSVAEVERDGGFSFFPNYQRCLTVVAGHGMVLEQNGGNLAAELLTPVWFSGDDVIFGRLNNGPCRDFNVIYDPSKFSAEVAVGRKNVAVKASAVNGVYVIDGSVTIGDEAVPSGDFAVFDAGEIMHLTDDAVLLTVMLTPLL